MSDESPDFLHGAELTLSHPQLPEKKSGPFGCPGRDRGRGAIEFKRCGCNVSHPREAAPGEEGALSASAVPWVGRTSILIVDDIAAVRLSMQRGLQGAGFYAEAVADGSAALARLQTVAFDWIVTDIFMPGRDGFELIRLARGLYPRLRIVAMSGGRRGGVDGYLRVAQSLGADHVLEKPFTYLELLALLKP